jgi:hypothetical protein
MRLRLGALFAAAACLFISGCIDDPPPTEQVEWDEEACAATRPGNACLTMKFQMTDDAKEDVASLEGVMRWALYQDGEVSLFGPGDTKPSFEGAVANVVSFDGDGVVIVEHVPDIPPGAYQLLALLDIDNSKTGSEGEAVTFPSDGFDVPADQRTQIEVVLDYVL